MSAKLKSIRLFLSLIAVLALVAAVACAAEEEEEPAPQPETKAVAPAETAPTAVPAAKEMMKETPKEAPAEAMGEPALAQIGVNGNVTFRYDGPIPTKFNEAPIVAELVKKGELPPVEERLPEDPLVIPPPEAIGVYGGTWRRVYTWAGDHAITYTDSLLWADSDGSAWLPHMAKSVEMSNDNKTMTIKLRKGHKWSDGTPFTTADFQWGWDNIANNEEISPVFDANWVSPVTRNKPKFEVVDDTNRHLHVGRPLWRCARDAAAGLVPPRELPVAVVGPVPLHEAIPRLLRRQGGARQDGRGRRCRQLG